MRMPSDMPRPRPRGPRRSRQPGRGRVLLVIAAVALVVLITSLRGIAGFYTEYLWFDSLDQSGVFEGMLRARLTLFALFTTAFAVLLWINLYFVDRTAPRFTVAGVEDEVVARFRQLVAGRTGLVRIGVARWVLAQERLDQLDDPLVLGLQPRVSHRCRHGAPPRQQECERRLI